MTGWIRNGAAVAALILHLGPALASAADVEVNRPCPPGQQFSIDQVDHSTYDALLQRHVDGLGMVDYARWKSTPADLQALQAYLAYLGCVDLDRPASREGTLAFWINAYNAMTLHGILREYPTSSIRNHTAKFAGYNIWKDLLLVVDGTRYSLDDIEHSILRKMGEPRIHLALVCASKGCPQLWNRAYSAYGLDEQLTANGQRFLSRPENFRADPTSRSVSISRLFEWYGTDFAPTPAGQLRALAPMLPPGTEWAAGPGIRVGYLEYDWSLNDRRPVRR
jgi:hypothetical protein